MRVSELLETEGTQVRGPQCGVLLWLALGSVILGSATLPDGIAAQQTDLDALAEYVGEWRAEDRETPDGKGFHFEYRLEWFDRSRTIVDMTITQVFDLGEVRLLWRGFKGLDPHAGAVYYHGFSTDGRAARGTVRADGERLITEYTGWGAAGPAVQIRDVFTPIVSGRFSSHTELLRDGSWTTVSSDQWRPMELR